MTVPVAYLFTALLVGAVLMGAVAMKWRGN